MKKGLIKRLQKIVVQKIAVGTKNQITRDNWLESTLKKISSESRILDAEGANSNIKNSAHI
jgi:hypothetical protein